MSKTEKEETTIATLTINLKDIAGGTKPTDYIKIWSPTIRPAGTYAVSDAPKKVKLVDGQASIPNVPHGPIKVSFHVGGIADNRERRGTVPEGDVTVDLFDVLKNDITYTPEVISSVQSAKQDAVKAAQDAQQSENDAASSASAASQSASSASASAQTATTKASEANTSATTAGDHAAAADTARQGAVTAQGLAETARDEAETKVQDALDVALPTKADKVHEHTIEQVTGLESALTGANWYRGSVPAGATLDTLEPGLYSLDTYAKATALGLPTRVGSIEVVRHYQGGIVVNALIDDTTGANREIWTNSRLSGATSTWAGWRRQVLVGANSTSQNMDLRLDTTVGTRVFAGTTMIYGDTGWRDITSLLNPGWTGRVLIKRTTHHVVIRLQGILREAEAGDIMFTLPYGYIPDIQSWAPRWTAPTATSPVSFFRGQITSSGGFQLIGGMSNSFYGDVEMPCSLNWPTT